MADTIRADIDELFSLSTAFRGIAGRIARIDTRAISAGSVEGFSGGAAIVEALPAVESEVASRSVTPRRPCLVDVRHHRPGRRGLREHRRVLRRRIGAGSSRVIPTITDVRNWKPAVLHDSGRRKWLLCRRCCHRRAGGSSTRPRPGVRRSWCRCVGGGTANAPGSNPCRWSGTVPHRLAGGP